MDPDTKTPCGAAYPPLKQQATEIYMLLSGVEPICLTSNENCYRAQKSVVSPGLVWSPVPHAHYNPTVLHSLETLSLEDALPTSRGAGNWGSRLLFLPPPEARAPREHTSGFTPSSERTAVRAPCAGSPRPRRRRLPDPGDRRRKYY